MADWERVDCDQIITGVFSCIIRSWWKACLLPQVLLRERECCPWRVPEWAARFVRDQGRVLRVVHHGRLQLWPVFDATSRTHGLTIVGHFQALNWIEIPLSIRFMWGEDELLCWRKILLFIIWKPFSFISRWCSTPSGAALHKLLLSVSNLQSRERVRQAFCLLLKLLIIIIIIEIY